VQLPAPPQNERPRKDLFFAGFIVWGLPEHMLLSVINFESIQPLILRSSAPRFNSPHLHLVFSPAGIYSLRGFLLVACQIISLQVLRFLKVSSR
ncbi:MAG: hypothetical protein WD604_09030, partial [Balneolaceae bacterium]